MTQEQKMNNKSMRWLIFVGLCGFVTVAIAAAGRPDTSRTAKELSVDPEIVKISTIQDAASIDALVPPIDVPDHLLPIELRDDDLPSRLPVSSLFQFDHDSQATFHPHGDQICASGCALSNHPTPELSERDFDRLLKEFTNDPLSGKSEALEALLYYGPQVSKLLDVHGTSPLDTRHANFLVSELQKTHASVAIRIVDENGIVRATNTTAVVPMNRRHVFELEGNNLQSLVASGTVKRVGLDYLWTRL